jgi:uncharacterized protein
MNINIQEIKNKSIPVLKRYDIKKAAFFGSFARGEQRKNSDVDILVEFGGRKNKSLLDLIGLELEIQELLKRKVDILTYRSIHPLLKNRILREQKVFYEKGL